MPRRVHVAAVALGEIHLTEREAHHLRDVLRLQSGDAVEVFDDAGNVGEGPLAVTAQTVTVNVRSVEPRLEQGPKIVIASAIPKATRADWLVEKLSEIGVDTFIPLSTARAVVVPEGKNKFDRWSRLAAEAAKQSHRAGVMTIEPLTPVVQAMRAAAAGGVAWHLSTAAGSEAIIRRLPTEAAVITLFVGPEGGWTVEEIEAFGASGIPAVSLTRTILRIETAAIAGAAIVASYRGELNQI